MSEKDNKPPVTEPYVRARRQSIKTPEPLQAQPSAPLEPIAEDDDDKPKTIDESEAQGNMHLKPTKMQEIWRNFVQRVKVHEMLKCLEPDYNKLKIIREHTEYREVLDDRARGEIKKAEEDNYGAESQTSLFTRSQEEEERALARMFPHVMSAVTDPRYVGRTAIKVFRTRSDISDAEFEEVLLLCEDRVEQKLLRDAFQDHRDREKYLHSANERRRMLYDFVNSKFFVNFILVTIIVSIIGIFLLTFESIAIHYAFPLIIMDACIIGIFIVEAALKITIYREEYFRDLWNILDIIIIVTNTTEVFVDLVTRTLALSTDINASIYFKFLKCLRSFRLLHVIKFLPNLQVIVTTIFESIVAISSISVLMALFIFVFAVIGRGLFSEEDPLHFGSLWLAFITLFQLLTLDDWFEILEPEDQEDKLAHYWTLFFYLFTYIVIEYFVFLNLFVAVLVDNFQLTLAEAEFRKQKQKLQLEEEADKLEEELPEAEVEDADDQAQQAQKDDLYLDLRVEDYFPVTRDSEEAKIWDKLLKDMASTDFERFMWRRRFTTMLKVLQLAAFSDNPYTWGSEETQFEQGTMVISETGEQVTSPKPAPSALNIRRHF